MAPKRTNVKLNNFDYKKLTANDVVCPVCRTILIKPITLPCHHGFCSSCFEFAANAVCPLCRVRVGSWLRSATKSNKLVNESFWKAIQDLFPSQVRNKLSSLDENFIKSEDINITSNRHRRILHRQIDNFVESASPKNHSKTRNNRKRDPMETTNTSIIYRTPKDEEIKNQSKPAKIDLNSKEFTCRILCQDEAIQTNHEGIKTESTSNERSNSIEPECLYFKPIDYRRNPICVGRSPVKVPTEKPPINTNAKIVPPSGQIVTFNSSESAFARLISVVSPEEPEIEENKLKTVKKRIGNTQVNSKGKKSRISDTNKQIRSDNNCDTITSPFRGFEKVIDNKEERLMQEKADFELARKLHAELNSYKYTTRSSVFKRSATKDNIKLSCY